MPWWRNRHCRGLFATAWACSPRFRPSSAYNRFVSQLRPLWSSPRMPSRMIFRHSCRVSLTKGRADGGAASNILGPRGRGRGAPRHGGDQRHALCRRDAGAFDRLHGDGAAADGRRAGGPAARPRAAGLARTASRSRSPSDTIGAMFLQKEQIAAGSPRATSSRPSPPMAITSAFSCAATRPRDYGKVMEVMGILNSAGFTRIGLVTDAAKKPPPP